MVKRGHRCYGPQASEEKRSMDHFAGMDVSVKETSVCILDDAGKIVKEVKVASEPQALLKVLGNPTYSLKRIGLEAGPLSQWLFSALADAELPVICVETRHMQAVLKAQINKTDRNDARAGAWRVATVARNRVQRDLGRTTSQGKPFRPLAAPLQLFQADDIEWQQQEVQDENGRQRPEHAVGDKSHIAEDRDDAQQPHVLGHERQQHQ